MRKFLFIACSIFAGLGRQAVAQVFVSPKKVTPGITLALEINDAKDVEFIRNNIRRFYGVQKVRVNGTAEISAVSSLLAVLDDLDEVQLLKFSGVLSDDDLEKMSWVNTITVFLKNGREDMILFNEKLGKFKALRLIFEVVPENYDFLKGYKVKSLHIIAPFIKKEIPFAIYAAATIPTLREFGISIDRMSDLPPILNRIKNLEKLVIIDNLSWMTEKFIDDLSLLRHAIEYTDGANQRYMEIKYLASEAELTLWEQRYVMSLFPYSRSAALMNESGDSTAAASFSHFIPLTKVKKTRWPQYFKEAEPLPALTDGAYEFTGDNSRDMVFYPGNAMAVLIPANSMGTTVDGAAWAGKYKLKIKSVNRPGKYFAAGIPLEYDSAGRRYQLCPAGGLAVISALGDEQPLTFRNGYVGKIMFTAPQDTISKFYAWNAVKNKWENFYDYDYEFDDSKLQVIDFYNFYAGKKTAAEMYPADRSSLNYRFDRDGYFYLLEPGKQRISVEAVNGFYVAPVFDRAPKVDAYTLRRGRGLVGLKKEYTDKKAEPGIIRVILYDKTQMLFPELKPFENYALEIETGMNAREFSSTYIRGSVYSDVRIEQEGGQWFLDLKTENGYWRLTLLQPAHKWRKNPGRAKGQQQEFLRRMQQYKSILMRKEAAMQQYFASYQNAGIQNARATLFQPAKPGQNSVKEYRFRSMGAFAWAYPLQTTDTGQVNIRFTDIAGIPIDIRRAWVAHNKPFQYAAFGSMQTYNTNIIPSKLAYIACEDFSGRIYYITGEQYRLRGIKSNSLVFLPVNELRTGSITSAEIEKLLNIKTTR